MPPRMGPRPTCPQGLRGVCVQIQAEPRGCWAKPLEGEAWGQLSATFAKDKDNCHQLQVSGRESSGDRSQGLPGHPHAPGRLVPEPGPNQVMFHPRAFTYIYSTSVRDERMRDVMDTLEGGRTTQRTRG